MMALRPGRCYRKVHRPYTRQSSRRPRKGYIKGVPKPKISSFEMGKKGDYDKVLYLISKRNVQIRHNALESSRIGVVQTMEKNIGKGATFFFKIRVYPHHVLRENALATGAGADRYQQGMKQSFGKPISTAAQVSAGQKLMEVRVNEANVKLAKKALKQANYKLPTPCSITIEDMKKQ
ncbi:MAG: 50S ribosomal protein L16 [Candidatus Aenigmarchaeota archaeon]|nr:50S ribosomal protein L16 [Candidatus Aenigmarchaeota archaeon]